MALQLPTAFPAEGVPGPGGSAAGRAHRTSGFLGDPGVQFRNADMEGVDLLKLSQRTSESVGLPVWVP